VDCPGNVRPWRRRFLDRGLDGLCDESRPDVPRKITIGDVERVIVKTLEDRPENVTHWSTRSMAQVTGMSQSAISRIWRPRPRTPGTRRRPWCMRANANYVEVHVCRQHRDVRDRREQPLLQPEHDLFHEPELSAQPPRPRLIWASSRTSRRDSAVTQSGRSQHDPVRKNFGNRGNLPATRTSCGVKALPQRLRSTTTPGVMEYHVQNLKRAVVTTVAATVLAGLATPVAWAASSPSVVPSVAPAPAQSPAPSDAAAPAPAQSPAPSDAVAPAPAQSPAPSDAVAPAPAQSPAPSDAAAPAPAQSPAPSDAAELAHTGASSATNAVIGAGAAGLIAVGAVAVFVVRRRALR
jgi:hypothetical protein